MGEFTGVWIPAQLFEMIELETINLQEATILAIVGSFKDGCYVTNRYLGRKLGVGTERVRQMLVRLKEGKLLNTEFVNGKRWLWSPLIFLENPPRKLGGTKYNKVITKSRTAPRAGSCGEDLMFDETWAPQSPNKFDLDCAKRLKAIVVKKMKLPKSINLRKWADQFRILRKSISEERIVKALDWIDENATERKKIGMPRVSHPKHLRNVFDVIERLIEKDANSLSKVEVSEQAKTIVSKLMMLRWPKGSAEQLPAIVQLSLKNYVKFGGDLGKLRKSLQAQHDEIKDSKSREDGRWRTKFVLNNQRRLCERIRDMHLSHPNHFLEQWFSNIHSSIVNWDEWSGDLTSFIFKPDSKRFRAMGRQWTEEYCGDPDSWDSLTELMNELKA